VGEWYGRFSFKAGSLIGRYTLYRYLQTRITKIIFVRN